MRRRVGLSQCQLALLVGFGQSYISLIEHGKRKASLEFAHALEEVSSKWDGGPIRARDWLRSKCA